MNIEEVINNFKKYISFSEKECNFPSIFDWNWHMELANDIETLLTAYEKEKETSHYIQSQLDIANAKLVEEKEKNKELESDIQQKNFEIKCLNSDIKNMYCEEGVIAILEDNFDLSREEAIQILEEE